MRHRKTKITLDRNSSQRRVLLRNLANSLVEHERIVTTPAKAQATRAIVERMVTLGKQPTLHHRRQVLKELSNDTSTKKILEKLSPRYQTRPGGYTRVIKLHQRSGDRAAQVILEFIQ